MNKETVSAFQFAMLFLAGMTGSSIVFVPSSLAGVAKNGAWISLLLSLGIGLILLTCTLFLRRTFPGMTFVSYSRHTLGRWLTFLIAAAYVLALMWQVAGIVINISIFFNSTMLRQTPSYVINFMLFLIITLTAIAGFRAMGRMFAVLILVMYGFIVSIWLLAAPHYHPEYLQPIMPEGVRPILHGTYIANAFPYSEVVLYATLLPLIHKGEERKIGKMVVLVLLTQSIAFLISIVCTIMAFGPLSGDLKYSLFQLARLISIGDSLERIESVIGISFVMGSYMKATILFYILTKIFSELFSLKNTRMFIFPIGLICYLLSITMYANEPSFTTFVYVIWPLLAFFAYVLPVLIVFVVSMIKKCLR